MRQCGSIGIAPMVSVRIIALREKKCRPRWVPWFLWLSRFLNLLRHLRICQKLVKIGWRTSSGTPAKRPRYFYLSPREIFLEINASPACPAPPEFQHIFKSLRVSICRMPEGKPPSPAGHWCSGHFDGTSLKCWIPWFSSQKIIYFP